MNSQVLIDRELLAEYLSGHGEDWVEAGHKLREILDATPTPIPDAGGEVLTPALRQYLHNDGSGLVAGYDLELTQRIVSALQASAMVVPDGYKLVPIEPTAAQCFTAAFNLCNEFGDEFVRDNKQFALAAYRSLVAASSSAKGGE